MFGHPPRDAASVRHHAADTAVREVLDVVAGGDVDAAGTGQAEEELLPAAGPPLGLPGADEVGDVEDGLLAVADDRRVDEVGDRFGVEGGVATGQHDGIVVAAVPGLKRDAREIQGGEHVGVAEFGGEGQAEDVEGPHRPVAVDGELRDAVLAHQGFEVGPDRVGALGEDALAFVQHLVEDHDTLVGQAHLVGVRVHERPADVAGLPRFDGGVQFTPDVLDGFLHLREQSFELWKH